jgi:uncharacterized phage protein (TIGR01671 family)
MTDRLKFRIWDSLENDYRKFPEYNYIGGTFNLFSTDEKTVEQWTGLYDKNNKPIYEGDILGGVYGGYIAWCDNEKSFQMFSPLHECMSCSGDVLWQEIVEDDKNLEVIGNIHENHDLLGDKTDE